MDTGRLQGPQTLPRSDGKSRPHLRRPQGTGERTGQGRHQRRNHLPPQRLEQASQGKRQHNADESLTFDDCTRFCANPLLADLQEQGQTRHRCRLECQQHRSFDRSNSSGYLQGADIRDGAESERKRKLLETGWINSCFFSQ